MTSPLGHGRSRVAWRMADGRVLVMARPGWDLSPESWRRHAVHLRRAAEILPTVEIHRVMDDGMIVSYAGTTALADVIDPTAEQRAELQRVVESMVRAGIYVGDCNPKNLHWYGGRWIVIDCGASRQKSAEGIRERLAHKWRRVPWAVRVAME